LLFDGVGVECFSSFWENDKYLEYLSAEVGKIISCYKSWKIEILQQDVWK